MSTSSSSTNRRHISVCSVCGDKASGKHYGVMSCDGCRGFFKRSVRRKIEYKCKGDSTCQVDVNRRNQCQACRFQRCLAMKMKPSAVQNERAPRHGAKRAALPLLPPPPPPPSIPLPRIQCWTPPTAVGYVNESPQVTMSFGFRNLAINNTSSPLWSRMIFPQQKFNSSLDSTQQTISDFSNTTDETRLSLDVTNDEIICETASFLLLESIRWLYLVPSFKDLNEYDQYLLIEQSWSIIFLLTSAEMKKFIDQNENESFDEENQYSLFQSIVKDLILHSIDQTEYTLLKLIIIFSIPTNYELNERFIIDKYRKDALFMLNEYTKNSKYRRLAELLMLLSHIQETMSTIYLDKIFFRHLINRISMQNLLRNIIRHIRTFSR
ncbi:unnamed protein product [Rotaria sordida]|uniref:Nuclear receptor n=1 Tax=Rotaria sordida TaxID=392033 RepID=A0A814D3Y4_9BILA|nr:unnamed protein product [Rotaria sordida]CAF1298589.1 unnamed protein product [Rotaria sordida]